MYLKIIIPIPLESNGRNTKKVISCNHAYMCKDQDFRPELAANAGQYWPARTSNAPVGRRNDIATTSGAAGAPTYRLCS